MSCKVPGAAASSDPGAAAPERSLCISAVQRYSLHDGGGIRSVAFTKGCPFSCPWCCNPENLSFEPEVSWQGKLCIGCSVRPDGSRDRNGAPCDTPPERCPTGAKKLVGEMRTVSSLAAQMLRDKVFFEESDGGVTVSGGECLAGRARQEAVVELLDTCRVVGVRTAIETTLATPLEVDAERLVAACDVFLVDFKIADRARSMEVTGIDPQRRDANLRAILAHGAAVVARMPIIPGYTDGLDNVRANAVRAVALGISRVDILPFHQLGEGKYDSVGRSYTMEGVPQLHEQDVADAVALCESFDLKVVVRGE